jgi:hypothetical protein
MGKRDDEKLPEFVQGALSALRRAAKRAREVAIETNTNLIVVVDGKIVHITPEQLVADRDRKRSVISCGSPTSAAQDSQEHEMTIRERLHQEVERIPEEALEEALRVVETLTHQNETLEKREHILERLMRIQFDGPPDLPENLDLYATGEKRVHADRADTDIH